MAEVAWEYEDFDFDNRVTNLMWTICGDYDEVMPLSEKSNLSKNIALYYGILAGGRRKVIDWLLIEQYIAWRQCQGFSIKVLRWLVHQGIDAMVAHCLIQERPGIEVISQDAAAEMWQLLELSEKGTFEEQVEKSLFALRANDGEQKCTPAALIFARKLVLASKVVDTKSLIKNIDGLYCEQYAKVMAAPFSLKAVCQMKTGELSTTNQFIKDAVKALLSKAEAQKESTNSEDEVEIARAEIQFVNPEELADLENKVVRMCGAAYLKKRDTKRLEQRLCKGPHRDCKLHYTDGLLRSQVTSPRSGLAEKIRDRNWKVYEGNRAVYEQTITRLKNTLIQTLRAERENYEVDSDSGIVSVRKLWRIGRVPTTRLFHHIENNDKGGYVVDLLIDSSFSQQGRKSRVAIQAYCVARALVEAGIPCRVTGFYCYYDYTVLKRYRDFDEAPEVTGNLFEYDCDGSNRDGLAIKGVCDGLYRRPEENRILIVLSDGKPNDIHLVSREANIPFRGQTAYTGGAGIGDTAKEVRVARQRGITVLGIFTGKETDLEAEKHIYGKDFIYTRELGHFADIVGVWLKRVIRQ